MVNAAPVIFLVVGFLFGIWYANHKNEKDIEEAIGKKYLIWNSRVWYLHPIDKKDNIILDAISRDRSFALVKENNEKTESPEAKS